MYKKILSVTLILGIFAGFVIFDRISKSTSPVLKILSPVIIQADLNNNGIADSGETICLPDIEAFTSDLKADQDVLAAKMKISAVDAIKLGYLTDIFVENNLKDKNIKLKLTGKENQNCKYAHIYVNNESYEDKLLNSGLGFYKYKPRDKTKFDKTLAKARKLNLVILNHKSNKYHKLTCKYGLAAHDAIVILQKQIPEDAKPCKFCHITKSKHKSYRHFKKHTEIPSYPLSISNGSIKMYLTDMTTKLKPDNNCSSLACREIVSQINNSKTSIDMALYGWDNVPEVYNALKHAKSRGVKIRIAYDTSSTNYYKDTEKIVRIADESATESPKILMHNKFIIYDSKSVITGSMNFSKTGLSGFNSNCIFYINSAEIAKIYQEEFNQMISGKFHTAKSSINHRTIMLGTTKVTPLFSPKDKIVTSNIIPMIDNARHYIYIPAFLITHEDLTSALVRAKHRNVDVKIIVDATNTTGKRNKVKTLRAAGIPVKVENYAGKLHSKSMIIDDKYIIAGSMNFSKSGENKNDENVLIIEDTRLAKYYKGYFEYFWKKIPNAYLKHNVRAEGKYSIGSCSDGIDNNYDGKIDMQDAGCK